MPLQPASGPPVVVLGVWRSGTTLLKEMLDHHSQLAIPSESYFVPMLWDRFRARQNIGRLLIDLTYLMRLREWGVKVEDVQRRLPLSPGFPDVVRAVYECYAEQRGKNCFGDKTPVYMRHLGLLEYAFSCPRYVHIVRDGRDAALSFDEMPERPRRSWFWPQSHSDFARRWRDEVEDARKLGATVGSSRYLELTYEDLVARPEAKLREICAFLDLRFEPVMLAYHRDFGHAGQDPNHPRLAEPPSAGRRNWRDQMPSAEVERFEAIAGSLLTDLGYERAFPRPSAPARARSLLDRAASHGRSWSVRLPMSLFWRSPAWRWRQSRMLRRVGSR
jgi:hypothetical protein